MAIRLWPQDYERKDHITKAEKGILRYAARNFQNGHMVVGIDPVGLSGEKVKLGMYISPNEGLVTFSIYSGMINAMPVFSHIAYVQMVESKIYERLLDSKLLIVRNGEKKALKFPYKHIVMFPDEVVGKTTVSKDDLQQLRNYATFDSFRPITSDGKEKRIEDLKIFAGIRKAYDKTFKSLSELECRAIFERLAPEYTVVMNETINVCVAEKKTLVTEADLRITGKELEYKTFFLDEYQVGVVNDMGKGHRVILANPGAGKSVLLLSKAFKYASLYKGSNVLLTCYNSNLADSYNFKRSCANFGKDSKLFIMTFHKLVKKIYESALKKCRFFDSYGKKNVLQKEGTFDCKDNQETCDLFYPFIEKCLLYIRETCLDEWDKGDQDSGMLTMNRGIQAVIRVIDDVVNMLVEKGMIQPKTQALDDMFGLIQYYLKPLTDYINSLNAEQRKDLRGYFGGGADTRFWRAYQKAIADMRPDFVPDGLEEFWQNETKIYNEETKSMLREIESKVKLLISERLGEYFGDSWLIKGLPKNIYTRAKGEADEAMYVHVSSTGEEIDIPIWDYVTLPECKQIILNGKKWSLFFEDTFVRPEEANLVGGKDPKTDWILRVNSISNKLSKESYSVPVDEYSYVKSIYDWLMGILVF